MSEIFTRSKIREKVCEIVSKRKHETSTHKSRNEYCEMLILVCNCDNPLALLFYTVTYMHTTFVVNLYNMYAPLVQHARIYSACMYHLYNMHVPFVQHACTICTTCMYHLYNMHVSLVLVPTNPEYIQLVHTEKSCIVEVSNSSALAGARDRTAVCWVTTSTMYIQYKVSTVKNIAVSIIALKL